MDKLIFSIRKYREQQRKELCKKQNVPFIPLSFKILNDIDKTSKQLTLAQIQEKEIISNVVILNGKKLININGELLNPKNR